MSEFHWPTTPLAALINRPNPDEEQEGVIHDEP